MKKRNSSSRSSLAELLLYAMRGLFLWYVFRFVMYFVNQIAFTLIHGKTPGMMLPVVFRSSDKGILHMPHTDFEFIFSLPVATGSIHAFTLPPRILYLTALATLLTYACTLVTIYLIIKMLKNARDGNFLISKNAVRLRSIALLSIAMFVIDKVFIITSSYYFSDKLEFPGIEFSSTNWYSFERWPYVFLYLFLIIIAEAFIIGAKAKQENDLTI